MEALRKDIFNRNIGGSHWAVIGNGNGVNNVGVKFGSRVVHIFGQMQINNFLSDNIYFILVVFGGNIIIRGGINVFLIGSVNLGDVGDLTDFSHLGGDFESFGLADVHRTDCPNTGGRVESAVTVIGNILKALGEDILDLDVGSNSRTVINHPDSVNNVGVKLGGGIINTFSEANINNFLAVNNGIVLIILSGNIVIRGRINVFLIGSVNLGDVGDFADFSHLSGDL